MKDLPAQPDRPALAIYCPDIAGNTGALIRLAACTGCEFHLVEPAGFRHDEPALRRAGMDYVDIARVIRHLNWDAFQQWRAAASRRLVLLTTRADQTYPQFAFANTDILLLGSESSGVPQFVHDAAEARVRIPMAGGARSLNVALAGAMVLGEALRQTIWA